MMEYVNYILFGILTFLVWGESFMSDNRFYTNVWWIYLIIILFKYVTIRIDSILYAEQKQLELDRLNNIDKCIKERVELMGNLFKKAHYTETKLNDKYLDGDFTLNPRERLLKPNQASQRYLARFRYKRNNKYKHY